MTRNKEKVVLNFHVIKKVTFIKIFKKEHNFMIHIFIIY